MDSTTRTLSFGLSRTQFVRALFGVAIVVAPLALLALIADAALGKAVRCQQL
jgi:preprotein translocase subunit SecE